MTDTRNRRLDDGDFMTETSNRLQVCEVGAATDHLLGHPTSRKLIEFGAAEGSSGSDACRFLILKKGRILLNEMS